jgi:hypothetical protein
MDGPVTLINVFTVAPENPQRLIDLLTEITERSVRHAPRLLIGGYQRMALALLDVMRRRLGLRNLRLVVGRQVLFMGRAIHRRSGSCNGMKIVP